MKTKKIFGLNIVFRKNSVTIEDSYKVANVTLMELILNLIRKEAKTFGYCYRRSNVSWLLEWKAHNLLYKLNLFRKHTRDTDFDDDENKFRLLCYQILGK